ncbi:ABC transporter, ATP-binding protein [Aeromicrobium marinum DSM 15272]|uniref:ABC transporter, ATP-binding protein n=1 Tax=Aeromicrobium marinum DSM 15272 TaxID=585531 RepID=E2SBG2_9ACTN|nr:ATP-binding cassette domain-containing protein [Aeromicrobium marinum]EFQ83708.1 ABC transporter, ATP-binding protein [Aeromicrobium marinum DSM 15272]
MTLHAEIVLTARDVSVAVDVGDGETVALLGPNGAGKSSLLGAVAGLLRPDAGVVVLDGRVLVDDSTWVPPHARGVAMLAQDPLLFPHLTALHNVAFGPRSTGHGRAEATRRAREWLEALDVGHLADRRPAELSGGQAQRVALGRALAAEPRLLLLDEPMAALDVAVAPQLRQVLQTVLHDRTTVVVTHDPLDALLLADRVVVIEAGRVVESGPTREVLARPRSAFAARIAGLNLVSGRVVTGGVRTREGSVVAGVAAPGLAAGSDAVAVFSPAAVAVHRDPPGGSPRNVLPVRVTELEPRGELVRVRAGDLSADVTLSAAADLALVPGTPVLFVVKAREVALHPAGLRAD